MAMMVSCPTWPLAAWLFKQVHCEAEVLPFVEVLLVVMQEAAVASAGANVVDVDTGATSVLILVFVAVVVVVLVDPGTVSNKFKVGSTPVSGLELTPESVESVCNEVRAAPALQATMKNIGSAARAENFLLVT